MGLKRPGDVLWRRSEGPETAADGGIDDKQALAPASMDSDDEREMFPGKSRSGGGSGDQQDKRYRDRSLLQEPRPREGRSRSRSPVREERTTREVVTKPQPHAHTSTLRKDVQPPCRNCSSHADHDPIEDHAVVDRPYVKGTARKIVLSNIPAQQLSGVGQRKKNTDSGVSSLPPVVTPCLHEHPTKAAADHCANTKETLAKDENYMSRDDVAPYVQPPCLCCLDNGDDEQAGSHPIMHCNQRPKRARIRLLRNRWNDAVRSMEDLDTRSAGIPPFASESSVPETDDSGQDNNWAESVLDEILKMEMEVRPASRLQVFLAVENELKNRLMEDVLYGDPKEGTPISIPLLEVLRDRLARGAAL